MGLNMQTDSFSFSNCELWFTLRLWFSLHQCESYIQNMLHNCYCHFISSHHRFPDWDCRIESIRRWVQHVSPSVSWQSCCTFLFDVTKMFCSCSRSDDQPAKPKAGEGKVSSAQRPNQTSGKVDLLNQFYFIGSYCDHVHATLAM